MITKSKTWKLIQQELKREQSDANFLEKLMERIRSLPREIHDISDKNSD